MKQHNNTKSGYFEDFIPIIAMAAIVAIFAFGWWITGIIAETTTPAYNSRPHMLKLIDASLNGDENITIANRMITFTPANSNTPVEIEMTNWELRYLRDCEDEKKEKISQANDIEKAKVVDEYFKSKPKQVEAPPGKE